MDRAKYALATIFVSIGSGDPGPLAKMYSIPLAHCPKAEPENGTYKPDFDHVSTESSVKLRRKELSPINDWENRHVNNDGTP